MRQAKVNSQTKEEWQRLLITDQFTAEDPRRYIVSLGCNTYPYNDYRNFPPRLIAKSDLITTLENHEDTLRYYTVDVYLLYAKCIWWAQAKDSLGFLDKLKYGPLFAPSPDCSGLILLAQGRKIGSDSAVKISDSVSKTTKKLASELSGQFSGATTTVAATFSVGLAAVGIALIIAARIAGSF